MENKKYGNLEIIIEALEADVTQEHLDELMDYIIEKVESMGLTLAGRSYISIDEGYEDAEEYDSQILLRTGCPNRFMLTNISSHSNICGLPRHTCPGGRCQGKHAGL